MADKIKDVTVRFKTETDEVKRAGSEFDVLNTKINDTANSTKKVADELNKLLKKVQDTAAAEKNAAFNALSAAEKRQVLIKQELALLEDLKNKRKQAFDPDSIRAYGDDIKKAQSNIKTLGGSYASVSKGANAFIKEQVGVTNALKASNATIVAGSGALGGLATGAKKAFGGLRTLAQIIPGIGISGLILAGYEALVGLFSDMTSSLGDNEAALKTNKEAVDDLIASRDAIIDQINSNFDAENVLIGTLTTADEKRNAAKRKAVAEEAELDKKRVALSEQLEKDLGLVELRAEGDRQRAKHDGFDDLTDEEYEQNQKKKAALKVFDEERLANSALIEHKLQTELDVISSQERKKREDAEKDAAEKSSRELTALKKKLRSDEEQAARQGAAEGEKIAEQFLKEQEDALKLSNEKKVLLTEEGSDERLQAEIDGINALTQFELDNTETTEQERLNIIAKGENEILKLKLKDEEDFAKLKAEGDKELYEKQTAEAKKAAEAEMELNKQKLAAIQDISVSFIQSTADIANNNSQEQEKVLDLEQDKKIGRIDALLEADNLSEQQRSDLLKERADAEKQFANQKAELQRQQARREKAAALFSIAIDTAAGIIAALKIPPPAGEIAAAERGTLGGLQAAVVISRPIPFAKGVIDLQQGRGGVDDVPAVLMKHESVMTSDETREHKDLFQAIRNDYFDKFIAENYIKPNVEKFIHYQGDTASNMAKSFELNFDEHKLSRVFRRNKGVIVENMPNGGISGSEQKLRQRRGLNG